MSNNTNHTAEENSEAVSRAAREEKVSELEILKQSLEEKKRLADDYYDQLLRLKAEFENFRRRTEREKQTHQLWGKEEILQKQLGLLDVLEQASRSAQSSTNIESIQKGIELIKNEFVKMIAGEGVVPLEVLGKKFDPATEEALEYVDSDKPDGTVIDVIQKGYLLNGRVIRPARVRVAKNKHEQEHGK